MLFFARLSNVIVLLVAAGVMVAFAVSRAQAQTSYTQRMPNGDYLTTGPDGSGAYSMRMPNGDYATSYTPGFNPDTNQPITQQQLHNMLCYGRC